MQTIAKIRALLMGAGETLSLEAISARLGVDASEASDVLEQLYLKSEVERRYVTLGEYGSSVHAEYRWAKLRP